MSGYDKFDELLDTDPLKLRDMARLRIDYDNERESNRRLINALDRSKAENQRLAARIEELEGRGT